MARVQNRMRLTQKFIKSREIEVSQLFKNNKFGVEHALDMYATSFVTLPAEAIYEKESLAQFKHVIEHCHIYVIGYQPKVDFIGAEQIGSDLKLSFTVANEDRYLIMESIPPEFKYKVDDGYHYIEDPSGSRFWWDDNKLMEMLNNQPLGVNFKVKYIGQAYGRDGSRNALDRLLKHETLQRIAIKGIPDGYKLSLLLLEVEPNNSMITAFTPNAQFMEDDGDRIKAGLDKLFGTSESERVSLFEAALIRYFSPEYNKEFKNSFPSTNLKLLHDCYEKDISAVFAQICIDEIPFKLYSEVVEPKQHHISKHDLHDDDERKVFFAV